jgi:hypothetical protein
MHPCSLVVQASCLRVGTDPAAPRRSPECGRDARTTTTPHGHGRDARTIEKPMSRLLATS